MHPINSDAHMAHPGKACVIQVLAPVTIGLTQMQQRGYMYKVVLTPGHRLVDC